MQKPICQKIVVYMSQRGQHRRLRVPWVSGFYFLRIYCAFTNIRIFGRNFSSFSYLSNHADTHISHQSHHSSRMLHCTTVTSVSRNFELLVNIWIFAMVNLFCTYISCHIDAHIDQCNQHWSYYSCFISAFYISWIFHMFANIRFLWRCFFSFISPY